MPKPTSLPRRNSRITKPFFKTAPTNLAPNLSYQYRADTALKTPTRVSVSRRPPHSKPPTRAAEQATELTRSRRALPSEEEEAGDKLDGEEEVVEHARERRRGCDCEAERALSPRCRRLGGGGGGVPRLCGRGSGRACWLAGCGCGCLATCSALLCSALRCSRERKGGCGRQAGEEGWAGQACGLEGSYGAALDGNAPAECWYFRACTVRPAVRVMPCHAMPCHGKPARVPGGFWF